MNPIERAKEFHNIRKRCKPYRKEHKIHWLKVAFLCDNYDLLALLPTIIITPWFAAHNGNYLIDCFWLNFHVAFAQIERIKN